LERHSGGKTGLLREGAVSTWRLSAACAEIDPELWFPEQGQATHTARRICRRCEVRLPCLRYALRTRQQYGVWGGFSARQRSRMRLADAERAIAADPPRPEKRPDGHRPGCGCQPCRSVKVGSVA